MPTTTRDEGYDLDDRSTPPGALLAEVWASRPLIAVLARKDFFVRYRRASFGLLWAVGLPLVQAIVLAVVFSRVVRIDTPIRYVTFVFAGMVGWTFVSTTISQASTAIVDGASMSNRIYFPRAVLPLVGVAANMYGLVITLVLLVGMAAVFGGRLGVGLLWLGPAVVMAVAFTASLSLLAAGLHVYFRDIRYIVQAVLTVWFYVTPVVYPLGLTHGLLRLAEQLNPATGVVELFRLSVGAGDPGWGVTMLISAAWILGLSALALYVHCRYNRVFADLL